MSEKLIKPILEGLLGFRLFESKCGMSGVYTEYFYYPAFYKIIFHRDNLRIINEFTLKCDKTKSKKGRPDSIDFVLKNVEQKTFNSAFELKVKTGNNVNCKKDLEKLKCFLRQNKNTRAYIIIFSTVNVKHIQKLSEKNKDERDKSLKNLLLSHSNDSNEYKKFMKCADYVYYTTSNRTYIVTAFRVTLKKNK